MKEVELKVIEEEIGHLILEMKHLDEQYISKQTKLRKLRKKKEEVASRP